MSVLGDEVGIISIGMSCQTSHQIKTNVELLRELTGDMSLVCRRMPFDWLICAPNDAAAMVEDSCFYPDHLADLKHLIEPYWSRYNCFFWHEAKLLHDNGFETFVQKYRHIAENFSKLGNLKRRIFILSNTQNNLEYIQRVSQILTIEFNAKSIKRVIGILDKSFIGGNEYIVVTQKDRASEDLALVQDLAKIIYITQESHDWQGDNTAWETLFKAVLSAK